MAIEQRRSFVLPPSTTIASQYDSAAANHGVLQQRSYNSQPVDDRYEQLSGGHSMKLDAANSQENYQQRSYNTQSNGYEPLSGRPVKLNSQGFQEGYQADLGREQAGSQSVKLNASNFQENYQQGISASHLRVSRPQSTPRSGFVVSYDEKKFDILWQRLWESEGFRKYRDGQEKGQRGSGGAQVWPIPRENAFFRACVAHEPMGRSKRQCYSSKSLGRNELIAAFINNLLGLKGDEALRRKQVSSHIQVLKGYFKDNKYVLSFLQGDKKSVPKHQVQKVLHSSRRLAYIRPVEDSGLESGLPLPSNMLLSQSGRPQHSNNLQFTDFKMCLQNERKKILHIFTRLQKGCGMPNIYLDERPNWPDLFPELAELHKKKPITCDVLFAEATLKLIDVATECDLAVESRVISKRPLPKWYKLMCETRIYEQNYLKTVKYQDVLVETPDDYSRWAVPFISSYWVDKFSRLKSLLRQAGRIPQLKSQGSDSTGPSTPSRASLNKAYREVRNDIEATTAVQQIFAYQSTGQPRDFEERECLLVIYWKFKQASGGGSEEGTTQTRYLFPPQQSDTGQQVPQRLGPDEDSQALVQYAHTPAQEIDKAPTVPHLDPSVYEFDAVPSMAALPEPSSSRAGALEGASSNYSHEAISSNNMAMDYNTADNSYSMAGLVESDAMLGSSYYSNMDIKNTSSSHINAQCYGQPFRFWGSGHEGNTLQYETVSSCDANGHAGMSGFPQSQVQQYSSQQQPDTSHRLSHSTATDDFSRHSYGGSSYTEEGPAEAGQQQPQSHDLHQHQSHYSGHQQQRQQQQQPQQLHPLQQSHSSYHHNSHDHLNGVQNQYGQFSYHGRRLDDDYGTSPITPRSENYYPVHQQRHSSIVGGLLPSVMEK